MWATKELLGHMFNLKVVVQMVVDDPESFYSRETEPILPMARVH